MKWLIDSGFSQVITWLVIISGWFLVNKQNNIREKRKEIRTLADKVQTLLDDVEKKAIEYHTSKCSDELAFQIKRDLNINLCNKLDILKRRKFEIEKADTLRKKLRQAVTLNNFDTSNFQAQPISGEIIKEISLSKEKLSHEIEICFTKYYD